MKNFNLRRQQRGVTLVELMVAMLLGLVLVAGTIQLYSGNRITYKFTEGLARIQENGRFALDHIAYTARMSGYRGCLSNVSVFNNLNSPNPLRDDIENGLVGHDANGTGTADTFSAAATDPVASADVSAWTPALPAELNNRVLPGSDVLIIRSISGPANTLVAPFSTNSELLVTDTHDFIAGEILVASDCTKASIFQVTDISASGSLDQLVHGGDAGFDPGNATSAWGLDQAYGLGAEVARLQAHAFYVGRGADNRPALFQLRLQWQDATTSDFVPEELVPGVETLQIRYGIDTDNSGAPNSYVSAGAVGDWANVLSAEITLLIRSDEEYGAETDTVVYTLADTQFDPVDDRRFRQVFSTSIGLRNRLP